MALSSTRGSRRIEQARNFNTALILAPQTVAGMGGEEEAARILGSVETVVCHALNTPDEIVALAGNTADDGVQHAFLARGLHRRRHGDA